jgi:hypothetical protein
MMPEQFLKSYEPGVQQLAQSARELLLKTIPNVKEELDIPAKIIAYSLAPGYKGTICAILLSKTGVKLGFYKGSELPDPKKLLEGSGKVHRYVKITDEKILHSKAVKDLIIAGIKACALRMK